jgi:homoserine kinase
VRGPAAADLPRAPRDNLVWQALELFSRRLRRYGLEPAAVRLTLHKNLPISSGLGSSASSIAAALTALNAVYCEPFSPETLIEMAGEAEGFVSGGAHYDNVAPALLGGLQLLAPGECLTPLRLPFFERAVVVVVHPDLKLPTARARAVLPRTVSLSLCVAAGSNLAALVHALHARDRDLFAECLRDLLAEPRRKKLVAGFEAVQAAALQAGALGCSLSGSGPSLFAVADSRREADRIAGAMTEAFRRSGVEARAVLCRPDFEGARLLP